MKHILITGGAGFIGSHAARWFTNQYPGYNIYVLDVLTYAGNLENLTEIENMKNYFFIKGNINDRDFIFDLFHKYKFTDIIHLAAETHVDRSITNPISFIQTNITGTVNLLDAANQAWKDDSNHLFYHISTDEVFGSLGNKGFFVETTSYDPQSPYSASKASSDHFVRAYFNTYKLPAIISNCSNNYGPNQFPEKLIPLCINNIKNGNPLPIYGKGEQIRDWLYVLDHVAAMDLIFHKGKPGESYNVGGLNEWKNIDLVRLLCRIMDQKLGNEEGTSEKLITFVTDRAGHDFRYAIDPTRLMDHLGWKPSLSFEQGLKKTVDWYLANHSWLEHVTSGSYMDYYTSHYKI